MPRDITSDAKAQLTASIVQPCILAQCQFRNETIYAWTGIGTLSWNGHTWLGVGTLGQMSQISETTDLSAQGWTLTLSGIPSNLLTDTLDEMSTAEQALLYLGFLSNGSLIGDPIPAGVGMMDQPTIDLSAQEATITIDVETRLSDLQRSRGGRYTDADQRSRYPGDGSLRFVSHMQDVFINWQS